MITKDQLEQLALTWFQDTSFKYVYGPDIAPETSTLEETLDA
jgi:type I restriction enzyme R subunit